MYTHTYTHTHIHTYIHTNIHTYIHTYIHIIHNASTMIIHHELRYCTYYVPRRRVESRAKAKAKAQARPGAGPFCYSVSQ